MADIKWLEGNRIQIAPPKRTKKITGTRFATILGLNPWSTAFEMWCAITKTYEKPFEDTIYTVAGKTIEPKQARYMEQSYGMDIVRPSDVWGEDYFNKTWGDFFPESKHLGGMWDYLMKGEDGQDHRSCSRNEDHQTCGGLAERCSRVLRITGGIIRLPVRCGRCDYGRFLS